MQRKGNFVDLPYFFLFCPKILFMLDRIKKLFIVEDDDPLKKALEQKSQETAEAEAKVQEKATPTHKPSAPSGVKNARPTVKPTGGKVTDKFMDILMSAMDKNNIEGFDYLEYKQSLQSLQNMQMDEATRYQSAFAMAKTMGATPSQLLETANHYLTVLQTEEQKFAQALTNQKSKQIGDRQQRIDQLAQNIAQKEKQIEQLTKEIEVNRQETNKIKEQISDSTVKVENTKNNFIVTYQLLTSQIKGDIEKMKQYLK